MTGPTSGVFIFIGACQVLGGLLLVRFRREFVRFLVSIVESRPMPWVSGKPLGVGYLRAMDWLFLGMGIVFVLFGLFMIIASVA